MSDKHLKLFAICVNTTGDVLAVNFGRENGLLVAIRGRGYNGGGLVLSDDGLVVDVSEKIPYRSIPPRIP